MVCVSICVQLCGCSAATWAGRIPEMPSRSRNRVMPALHPLVCGELVKNSLNFLSVLHLKPKLNVFCVLLLADSSDHKFLLIQSFHSSTALMCSTWLDSAGCFDFPLAAAFYSVCPNQQQFPFVHGNGPSKCTPGVEFWCCPRTWAQGSTCTVHQSQPGSTGTPLVAFLGGKSSTSGVLQDGRGSVGISHSSLCGMELFSPSPKEQHVPAAPKCCQSSAITKVTFVCRSGCSCRVTREAEPADRRERSQAPRQRKWAE